MAHLGKKVIFTSYHLSTLGAYIDRHASVWVERIIERWTQKANSDSAFYDTVRFSARV